MGRALPLLNLPRLTVHLDSWVVTRSERVSGRMGRRPGSHYVIIIIVCATVRPRNHTRPQGLQVTRGRCGRVRNVGTSLIPVHDGRRVSPTRYPVSSVSGTLRFDPSLDSWDYVYEHDDDPFEEESRRQNPVIPLPRRDIWSVKYRGSASVRRVRSCPRS